MYEEATRTQRFLNYLIDLIVIGVFYILFVIFLGIFDGINRTDLVYLIAEKQFYWCFSIILFVYYLIFELTTRRTIGKFITNTKVMTTEFEKPTNSKIVLRTLCRLIPLEPLSGFTYPWHDTITSTCVVKIKRDI